MFVRKKSAGGKLVFVVGKYKRRLVADIIEEDPGYIRWMVENAELTRDQEFELESLLEDMGKDIFEV